MKILRNFIQFLACFLFVYQMQSSIIKYMNKPIVHQVDTKSLNDFALPVVYICQDAQFDFLKAKPFGYKSFYRFAMGQIGYSTKITWKGKEQNETFDYLLKTLFAYDYSALKPYASKTGKDGTFYETQTEDLYLAPFGFCKMLKKLDAVFSVSANETSSMVFVDPSRKNKIMLTTMENGLFDLGKHEKNVYIGYNYELTLHVYDSKLQDGITCFDYDQRGSSYGECIETKMRENLLKWYNCLPPWFPTNNTLLTCEQNKGVPNLESSVVADIQDEFVRLYTGYKLTMVEECMPPCLTMILRRKLLSIESNRNKFHKPNYFGTRITKSDIRLNSGYVNGLINNEVIVHTDTHAYDIFNLVVDLGSALGLWLGLSALSVFDMIKFAFQRVKERALKKSKSAM